MTDTRSPRPMAPPFPGRSIFFAFVATLAAFAVILNGYGSEIVKRFEQFYSDFRTSMLSDRINTDHDRVVIVSVGEGASSRSVSRSVRSHRCCSLRSHAFSPRLGS